jgi:hypothetical protein
MPIIPDRVPASKERIRAPPFSTSRRVVNSFSRWMLCTVTKAKIGNSTATAPSSTQAGTPVQSLVFLIRFIIIDGY